MSEDYEFSVDWFIGNAPVWRSMFADIKPGRALEIGSFEGRSAVFMIEQCASSTPFELTCVDTWAGGVEHHERNMADVEGRFDRNIARAKSRYPCTVHKIKECSARAMSRLLCDGGEEAFDFIYIDGSHQAADVLTDAVLAFRLLRIGGILAFDDYLWHMEADGHQDLLNMPKIAIDAFISTHFRKLKVILDAPLRQIFIAKIAS